MPNQQVNGRAGRPKENKPKRREIHLRVQPETYDRLKQLADMEFRTVPQQAELLLIKALDAEGC